ncbi:hypothetical protein QEH52_19105 [Coraliomargarita sp. SDUM461003]|uniref:Uncharacterized protein n=1 Tax=Thalassobacterium maritimum TaxID=3041265 RepID=A0ABU1AZR6_9BACT|nr:hypothetical protein [Coraliomargarita sp. SDUM461003]MDQ8209636.1 hypothetical protein [Coraliomargarita sp. SDUM461003]
MKLVISIFLILSTLQCFGEWAIVETKMESYHRENYAGEPELQLVQKIQNISQNRMYILGQNFGNGRYYYHIESYIKEKESQTWEKLNSSMCGSIGKIAWIEVKPNESIEFTSILSAKHLGSERLLTLKESSSGIEDISSGQTILIGPHTITKTQGANQPEVATP